MVVWSERLVPGVDYRWGLEEQTCKVLVVRCKIWRWSGLLLGVLVVLGKDVINVFYIPCFERPVGFALLNYFKVSLGFFSPP